MQRIPGSALTAKQRDQVLRAFVHRWTHENARQTYGGRCPACVQSGGDYEVVIPAGQQAASEVRKRWHEHHLPLVSDAEWLASYAFWFRNDGQLAVSRRWAEPWRAR